MAPQSEAVQSHALKPRALCGFHFYRRLFFPQMSQCWIQKLLSEPVNVLFNIMVLQLNNPPTKSPDSQYKRKGLIIRHAVVLVNVCDIFNKNTCLVNEWEQHRLKFVLVSCASHVKAQFL